MLMATARFPDVRNLRAVVVSAESASPRVREAVFSGVGERDAAPVAIVWYLTASVESAGGGVAAESDRFPPGGGQRVGAARCPTIAETIAAGEAIGFAVLAGASEGLASVLSSMDGRRLKSTIGLPPDAVVVALLLVGYPEDVSETEVSCFNGRFFRDDTATPFLAQARE